MEAIISMNIYFFAVIYISKNKYSKFIVICEFFLNGIKLHNVNYAFKVVLQKSTKLSFLVKCYSEWMIQMYEIIYNKIITMCKELK